MPSVLVIDGYRFFFFSNEGNPLERCHIHVRKGNGLAKFWIEPKVQLADSIAFSAKDLRHIEHLVRENIDTIREAWDDYFN